MTVTMRMATPKLPTIGLDVFEQPEQRLGQEVEPAPVDHEIEAVDLVLLTDGVDLLHHLGAGEEAVLVGADAAGRNGDGGLAEIIGLIDVAPVVGDVLELAGEVGGLIGDQGGRPVFVGEAEPAAGRVLGDFLLVVLQVRIVNLLKLTLEDADQALEQHIDAIHLGRALALDAGIGKERDGTGGLVGHVLLDAEEIVVVHRDGAGEDEAFAIVPGEGEGLAGCEHGIGRRLPFGLGIGELGGGARRWNEALLGEIAAGRA